jgi:hypothetical protein
LGGPIDYTLRSKYLPISFLKIDSASSFNSNREGVICVQKNIFIHLCSITLDGRSHPDIWISRSGFESNMLHAGSQVIPKVSSIGLSTIKDPVDEGHLAFILHTTLRATDGLILAKGRRLQVSILDIRST